VKRPEKKKKREKGEDNKRLEIGRPWLPFQGANVTIVGQFYICKIVTFLPALSFGGFEVFCVSFYCKKW
jgi:hypothetical protein